MPKAPGRQKSRRILAAIEKNFSGPSRFIFKAHVLEGKSFRQVAAELRLSASCVCRKFNRMTAVLRKILLWPYSKEERPACIMRSQSSGGDEV